MALALLLVGTFTQLIRVESQAVGSTVRDAEAQVVATYHAIVDAERAGYNLASVQTAIRQLVDRLNEQLERLDQARAALQQGDASLADTYALAVIDACDQVRYDAARLTDEAGAVVNPVVIAVVAVPATTIGSGLLYYLLASRWENRRLQRLLDMEIVYEEDEDA